MIQDGPNNSWLSVDAAIIVFDVGNLKSYQNIVEWKKKLMASGVVKEVPILLLANKIDNISTRIVTTEDIENDYKENGFFNYVECSARTAVNLVKSVELLMKELSNSTSLTGIFYLYFLCHYMLCQNCNRIR
jgi:GTPase SAR1 family protein